MRSAPLFAADSIDMSLAFRRGHAAVTAPPRPAITSTARWTKRSTLNLWRRWQGAATISLRTFERGKLEIGTFLRGLSAGGDSGPAWQRRHWPLAPVTPMGSSADPTAAGAAPGPSCNCAKDNLAGTLYNLVGFQTNLTWGEQKRVFGLIPAWPRLNFCATA